MGRYVAGNAPDMDRLVADSARTIGGEIEALAVPHLVGVVLGGGYGRGEGGVVELPRGKRRLSNDLDFYVVAEDGTSEKNIDAIGAALHPISMRWKSRLGVDVDFCRAKTPWRIRHDQERLMIQELLHGYVDVAGKSGAELFKDVERRQPSQFPWTEAVRLLVNRGVGLALANENPDLRFVVRNINKCILGAGDAKLIATGGYKWRAQDRAEALANKLYSAAVEWKFRPKPASVCSWNDAQEEWLGTVDEVMAAGKSSGAMRRSFYQAVRWIVRRRTVGDKETLGYEPVVRMLKRLVVVVRERKPLPESLYRDWEIFN